MFRSLIYYLQFGQADFLVLFFALLLMYLTWRMLTLFAEIYLLKNVAMQATVQRLLHSLLIITAALLVIFFVIGFAIEHTNANPQERANIAVNNHRLMQADHALFGAYLPFWFQDIRNPYKVFFDQVAAVLLNTYNSLSIALGGMLALLLLVKGRLCAHMFAMFILSLLLSIPIWYFFPALSPLEGYIAPIITPYLSPEIASVVAAYRPNELLQEFLDAVLKLRDHDNERFMAITTLPSMHMAWVTALTFYGIVAWRPLAIFLIPYFLLNTVAAVYTMQHYAVDLIAGVVIGILAIALAWWLKVDRWPAVQTVTCLIRDDLRAFGRLLVSMRSG